MRDERLGFPGLEPVLDAPFAFRAKEPLLLTAFEGLSQQEAGEVLGVSAKTIETRVHRARRILAERLDLRPSPE